MYESNSITWILDNVEVDSVISVPNFISDSHDLATQPSSQVAPLCLCVNVCTT